MTYGLFGWIIPVLMKKPVFSYLETAAPGISPAKVKKEYREIIGRQPEVGGVKNNLIMGLYTAAYLMAVYRASEGAMNEETFGKMVDAVCASDIFVKLNKNKEFFTEKNIGTRKRLQNDPEFNSYPDNWKYTFTCDMSVPECTITYTRCAICRMAEREGCFHLMKHLCKTDFVQQELMGNTLIRTKTIGNGDAICDFHIIGKKKQEG